MLKPSPPLMAAHLRTLLRRRHFSSPPPPPPPPLQSIHHHQNPSPFSLIPSSKPFSSSQTPLESSLEIAQSLSHELQKPPNSQSLLQRLDLSFSHITLTPSLILTTLNLSPKSGRTILDFHTWLSTRSDFNLTPETLTHFIDYFGRRHDFKAIHQLLITNKPIAGVKPFQSTVDRMVRAGRPTQVVALFDTMASDYGFVRDFDSLKFIVSKLCEHGFASYAEKLVTDVANEFFPDEFICDTLIKGWCVDGKLDEARRLSQEMYRGGFEIGSVGYNAILDCVCRLCRKKDPFRIRSEAENVLVDMDVAGVPRNVETFNVLINNLCKIRKTEDAMNLFNRMGEWGCSPNEDTFLVLIKSLYQGARVGEGDEMIDRMKSAGFSVNKKAYYEFLKILCGIERIDHALLVFGKMKKDGCEPGVKTYDLLMGKLCGYGRVDKANVLFKEAEKRGLAVEPKAYKLDPRFVKKPAAAVKEKKRETLPEKTARKRRRLKKIRLSFVKKPKKTQRRAY